MCSARISNERSVNFFKINLLLNYDLPHVQKVLIAITLTYHQTKRIYIHQVTLDSIPFKDTVAICELYSAIPASLT